MTHGFPTASCVACVKRAARTLGSRQPVRERRLSARPAGPRDRLQHEPPRHLLGSRRGREFLRDVEGRAGARGELGHPRAGAGRGLRVHRAVLQRPAAAFRPRLPESAPVRAPVGYGGRHDPGGRVAGPRRGGARESEGRRGSRSHAEEGGRYLGIPPAPSVTPISSIPGILEAAPPTFGRNPSSVSPHPLTAVSTEPGQVQPCIAVQHLTTALFLSKPVRPLLAPTKQMGLYRQPATV